MKNFLGSVVIVFVLLSCQEKKIPSVLVFSKSVANRHESIPAGKLMMLELGKVHKMKIDTTEDAALFADTTLIKYDAVVFMNTTGDVLDSAQQLALINFIKSGKGFVGIHSASDTEHDWPWYGDLVGAYFKGHPKVQRALFTKVGDDPLTSALPDRWYRSDEHYNFKTLPAGVTVLYKIDENSYEGGEHDGEHSMAWYHSFDGGRSFYTAMGHTPQSYSDPLFQQHILAGIQYAVGEMK